MAEVMDAWRVFPRAFLLGYGSLALHVAFWYMGLDKPSQEQTAFVTIVVSIFAPLSNWYFNSGRSWAPPKAG